MSIINGGNGNESITGTFSNDTLNGGAGSDTVNGGFGNDTLIYRLAENTGANDQYSGGSGTDIVRIELTQAEWATEQVQSEMTRYADFKSNIFNNLPLFGDLFPTTFTFNFGNGTTLSIASIETVEVAVAGQTVNLDVPVISTTNAGGTVYEDGNTDASPTTSASTAGTINFFDFDQGDAHVVSVAAPSGAAGTLTAAITNTTLNDGKGVVSWTYNLNNAAVQSMAAGQQRIESFTVRVADANNAGQFAETQVKIVVTGSNDGPVVSGPLNSTAVEGGAAYALNLLSGASDIDQGDVLSVSNVTYSVNGGVASATAPAGLGLQGGTLSVNPGNAAFDSLGVGQQRTITVNYKVIDGHGGSVNQTQTLTVTGTNDAPMVASALSASAAEGSAAFSLNLLSGASDVDQGDVLNIGNVSYSVDGGAASATAPSGLARQGSTLSVDPAHAAFDSLGVGQQRTITVNYKVSDGHGGSVNQTQTVTITGTNDAPTVASALSAATTEGDAAFTLNLLEGASDVDQGDAAGLSIANIRYAIDGGNTASGLPEGLSLDGGVLTVDPTHPAFASLNDGETSTIVFQYEVSDGHGGLTPQTQTITVAGVSPVMLNQAPVINAPTEIGRDGSLGTLILGEPGENWAVGAAGDVNGDGHADLLLVNMNINGATHANNGSAYVVFGQGAPVSTIDLSEVAAGVGGFRIQGTPDGPSLGGSITSMGDLNGDGFDDIAISSNRNMGYVTETTSAESRGEAYVVFGKADNATVQLSDVVAGQGGFVIRDDEARYASLGERIGQNVSNLGDINGDGLNDMLIDSKSNGNTNSRAYVVYGKGDTSAVNVADIGAGQGGFAIERGQVSSTSWLQAATATGDINGDGIGDMVLSTRSQLSTDGQRYSTAHVLFGGAYATTVDLASASANGQGFDIVIGGNQVSNLTVSAAGDVNGDGLSDVLLSDFTSHANGMFSGGAWVVFGKNDNATVNLADVNAGIGGFQLIGATFEAIGFAATGLGDITGDGLADLAVSTGMGGSYVVFGKADGNQVYLNEVGAGIGGYRIDTARPDPMVVQSLTNVGDWSGDGVNDLFMGMNYGFVGHALDAGMVINGNPWGGSLLDPYRPTSVPLSARAGEDWQVSAAIGAPITVSDPDNDALSVTVQAEHGTVSFAHTDGITFQQGDGTDDGSVTLSGSTADINAALATLSYRADADYEGLSTLTVRAYDGGMETTKVIDFNVRMPHPPGPIVVQPANFDPEVGAPVSEVARLGANDPDGEPLTYAIVSQVNVLGGGGTFSLEGGRTVVYDTMGDPSVVNAYQLLVSATDPSGLSSQSVVGVVFGTTGADELHGVTEDSTDLIYARGAAPGEKDVAYAGGGDDTVFGGMSDNELHGGDGRDVVIGMTGNDTLYGDAGGDLLIGLTGHDELHGGAGRDLLLGDVGDDVLIGGADSDQLLGGEGADVFVMDAEVAYDPTTGYAPEGYLILGQADLMDFNPDEGDVLQLSASVFQSLTQGTLDASNLVIGGADVQALDADDFILYDTRGLMYYDADGVGGAERVMFAAVVDGVSGNQPNFDLKASDIVVVA
jgi:VCBS repeat-containing protein